MQLGIDDAGHVVLLDDRQRAQHTYVLGKSGVGKTMLLAMIVLQDLLRCVPVVFLDLIGTAVPYLRQCLASINLAGLAAERGPYPALSERRRREREQFFRAIRILDLDTAMPLDRFNPLEPVPGMTTFELAEAFAAAIERMLGGKLSEMRALHLNLVGLASVVIDSGGTLQDMVDLCCLDTETLRQYLRRLERRRAKGRLGIPVRRDLVTRYMSEVFAATSGRERRELCASTLRALALILSDSVAREFLSAPRGNVNLQAVLDGEQSLLVNLPPRNLHTQTVIASLFLSRLSGLAMRRSSQDAAEGRLPQVHVVIDEFQRVFTEELAADLAVLRNKGLSMILAHQSSNQPPFHTPEGQAMLNSIGDNCSTKLLMRMGQKDAKEHAAAAYTPRGHLAKRQTQEVTRTTGESLGSTMSRAEAEGQSRTEGRSRTQSRTASLSRARTHSSSASQGTQTSRTRGQTQTRTEGESEGCSSTITNGQTRGSSFTRSEGHSQSSGESSGVGESHSQGVGHSSTVQETSGQGVGQRPDGGYQIQQNRSLGRTLGDSSSESQSHSHHRSETRSQGSSHSKAHGMSQSWSLSRADGRSSTRSVGRSEGESQSRTEGTSHTRTEVRPTRERRD